MGPIQIQCPACHAPFRVPAECIGKRARCRKCGHEFVIEAPNLDDTVLDWLNDDIPEEAPPKSAPARTSAAVAQPRPTAAAPATDRTAAEAPEVPVTVENSLRLSHTDALGAFVLFPPSLLLDPGFRSSMPRCCLGCGSKKNLRVHVVRWQSIYTSAERSQRREDDKPVPSTVGAETLIDLPDDKLLAALPVQPNVPSPYNLPFPYYICSRCSPVGAIMTHVRQDTEGNEVCEIGISSLKRAAQFLARNLGRDHEGFKRLYAEIQSRQADSWSALPLAVRNRIDKWFRAVEGERFVCYLRDADFAKAESGLGGLVITDRRVVFHKFASHREFPLSEPMRIEVDQPDGVYQITLTAKEVKPAVLKADPTVLETIHATLDALDATYTIKT
ncbi:MAG: MJ0042-type zinc finger domain-containing protein [Planctomycetota bacterium]